MPEFKIGDRVMNKRNWTNKLVPVDTLGTVVEKPEGSYWSRTHVQFDNVTPDVVESMFGYPTWPMEDEEIEHV